MPRTRTSTGSSTASAPSARCSAEMDDLYRENILEHYKNPRNWGEIADPDLEFFDSNPLCGDELRVQLKVDEAGRGWHVGVSGPGRAVSPGAGAVGSRRGGGGPGEAPVKAGRRVVLE